MKPTSGSSPSRPREAGGKEGCYLRSGMEWVWETSYEPSPAPSPDCRTAKVSSLSPVLSMIGALAPQSRGLLPGRCSRLGCTPAHLEKGLGRRYAVCLPACLQT